MFEQTFKNIDDIFHKDAGCSSEPGAYQLETLELIAKGLNSEVMLIPKEKLSVVLTMFEGNEFDRQSIGA